MRRNTSAWEPQIFRNESQQIFWNHQLLRRRHLPVPAQGQWIESVARGYYAYHAVPTNMDRLRQFRTQVVKLWFRALQRRSQRTRVDWVRMNRLVHRWIPPPRMLHPLPDMRFDERTRGRSRVR